MEQEELTTRLTKLEFLVERHDQSLSELWEHHLSFSKETTKALAAINKILIQIRAFAVGAAVVILADRMGFTNILKLLGV
jgi:hypothetical protein